MARLLESKIAVITGGATGIGLATAQKFVAEGAHVFIFGRCNPRGRRFYQKFGFESYGVMPRALRVQGKDHDALMMVRKFR